MVTYPDTYLYVRDCRTGEVWTHAIGPDECISLEQQVDAFIAAEWCGEIARNGEIMRRLDGDYYARIMTDGNPPEHFSCWDGGGFYVK